jgi:hypothetical protein
VQVSREPCIQTSAVEHELPDVLLHFGQLLHQDGMIVRPRARC